MNAPDYGHDAGHAAGAAEGQDAPGQTRLRQLADEQAALRRGATLVARGAPADQLFAAVTEEAGGLLPVDFAGLGRYESDDPLPAARPSDPDGHLRRSLRRAGC